MSLIPNLYKDQNFPIFSNLNPVDLGNGCQVCTAWNQYCSSDELWARFPELTALWEKDIKRNVNLCGVGSYPAIATEFEKFTNGLNSKGIFRIRWEGNFKCVFPFDGDRKPCINLEMGYGDVCPINKNPIDHCTKVFMKPLLDTNQGPLELFFYPLTYTAGSTDRFFHVDQGRTYKAKTMALNDSMPGAQALSQRVDQITNECIDNLKIKGNRCQNICKYSMIITYIALGYMAYYFLSPSFSGT